MFRRGLVGAIGAVATLVLVSCGSIEQSAHAGPEVSLVSLDTGWTTVNDPVMGGRSTSKVTYDDDGLVFSGTVSLDNNGGFASARSPEDPDIGRRATGATTIRVSAVGDGKTYVLKVGAAGAPWSYIQRFSTEGGVQRTYELPVAGFQPVGMRMDPAPQAPQTLDPSSISQVALYILDKQQGPFTISVTGIDATP